MGERAWVESVEALKKFRAALCKFAENVDVGLGEAEAEIQRTSFWLTQEQHNHWKRAVTHRTQLYTQARSALNRKKDQRTALGARYSYVDEEKALAAAARQLEQAQQKLANVRRWSHTLNDEAATYRATAQGLSQAVMVDIPGALAQLDSMVAALESYTTSTTPGTQRSTAPGVVGGVVGGEEESASMARPAPLPSGVTAEWYQRLRARTPGQAVRDAAQLSAPPALDDEPRAPPEPAVTSDSWGAVLRDLDVAQTPVAADDRIVVAVGAWQHERTYLERIATAVAGDSGWYLGFADDTAVTDYSAVRAADFVAERPELAAALELPAGCLLVLDGTSPAAVLDARNKLLWSSNRQSSIVNRQSQDLP